MRGGADDQAIGTSQLNLQAMMAAANVGNGMKVGDNSPVIIQSDNTFSQDADNSNNATKTRACCSRPSSATEKSLCRTTLTPPIFF